MHVGQPLEQGVPVGHREGDPGVPDLAAGADQPLGHGGLRDEERRGDLPHREAGDVAQGQRHPSLRGERRVAARQDEAQVVVLDLQVRVLMPVDALLGSCIGERVGGRGRAALSADDVERLTPRRGGQPRPGAVGNSIHRPTGGRGGERLLHGVLGQLEIPEPAGQGRDDPGPLLPPRAFDGLGDLAQPVEAPVAASISADSVPGMTGRTSTVPVRTLGTFAAQSSAASRSGTSSR